MAIVGNKEYFDSDAARAYVNEVRRWARLQLPRAKSNLAGLKNKDVHGFLRNFKKVRGLGKSKKSKVKETGREKLIDSLKTYTRLEFGLPSRVSFPFAQHGFYIQEGYSRGHGKENPRDKLDWYSFLFLQQKELLADIVVRHDADAAVKFSSNLIGEKI